MAKPGLGARHQAIAVIVRRRVRQGAPCWLCGLPIDLEAAPRTRWSFSVDHVTPRSKGGQTTLANARPAHYGCNSGRGNRTPGAPSTRRAWRPRRW